MSHNITGMAPFVGMSRVRNPNMYYPCGEGQPPMPPMQMQQMRNPCFLDEKHMPPHPCGMQMGEMPPQFKSPPVGSSMPPESPAPKKKRKTSTATSAPPPQMSPVIDMMPRPPTGYGDTIIASNPFDDTPHQLIGPPPPPPMGMPPHLVGHPPHMNHHHPHPHHHMGNHMGNPMNHMTPPNMGPINNMNPIMSPMANSPMGSSPMGSPMGNMSGPPGGPQGPPPGMQPNPMHMNMHTVHHPFGSPGMVVGPKPMPVSAGKIYPPDQPMVFNPQNPNAPPIYPCGICHKEVHDNDQAILCESGCNFWFHRICTGLTEAAFQLLTAEVYAEWVCDKCLTCKNIPLVKFKP